MRYYNTTFCFACNQNQLIIMAKCLSARGYSVLKESLSHDELDSIRKELSVAPYVPEDYSQIIKPTPFKLYQESSTRLYVPKYYGLKRFGPPENNKIAEGQNINLEFQGSLRPYQEDAVNSFLNAARDNNKMGGIINLYCGGGKTTMTIYIVCKLAKKTLIVCHKDFLLQQWKERIEQFTSNARIGMLKAKTVDVEHNDIVLASLQSLSMKNYDADIFKDFGFVCFDECFTYQTQILTTRGQMSIGDLFYLWENQKTLPLIRSYNEVKNSFEYKRLTYAWKKSYNGTLIQLQFANKWLIKCTPKHKIFTSGGWKQAKDIHEGDFVCTHVRDKAIFMEVQHSMCIVMYDEIDKTHVYDIEVEDNHNFIYCFDKYDNGCVVHNCHHLGAEVFSQALKKVNFKYSLGLSATINRKDGLSKVFKWHLGDVIFKLSKRADELLVKFHEFYDPSPEYSLECFAFGNKLNISRMINNICGYLVRSEFIVSVVQEILSNEPERRCIILSDRRNHLETLHKLLSNHHLESAFYVGGMSQENLKESETKQIILATYHIASEGFDCQGLDTLIFASPKSDVIQCVGRIQRTPQHLRKHIPMVIDIVDNFSIFAKQGKKRLKYYKSCKYTIEGDEVFNQTSQQQIELQGPSFRDEF